MNRCSISLLLLAGALGTGTALAQDYQRGRALERAESRHGVERGEARYGESQRGQPRYAEAQRGEHRGEQRGQQRGGSRADGAHWNNTRQSEQHWERQARQARDSGSRYAVDADKHYRYDDRRWQHGRGLPHSGNRYRDDRYHGDHRSNWRHPQWRSSWHHGWSGHRYRAASRYYYPQGYTRYHWRAGYILPSSFLVSSWYVDYRPYGIAAPPYGCRWVRVDGDLLLVELVSGHIVDVLYDFFY